MNFSVHLDSDTLASLAAAVKSTGLTRNRIIGVAVQEWLERNSGKDWPATLREHFGNPAPELAEETVDAQAWRAALAPEAPPSF